jgi:hypothetical protein
MKTRLALGLLVALGGVNAEAAEVRLQARESRAMLQPGATAAFAVDATVVEASIVDGRLVLVGLHAGETLVSVVHPTKIETVTVHVDPAPSRILPDRARTSRSSGSVRAAYDSGVDRLGIEATLDLRRERSTTRVRVNAVRSGEDSGASRSLALPSASIEHQTADRTITLLDQYVDASPLTLDGAVIRGAHLSSRTLEIHAGVASAQPWDDALVPEQGDRAASVAMRVDRGAVTFTPSVVWLPDSTTDVPGAVVLGVRKGNPDDALQLGAELGWSSVPGVAIDVSLQQPNRQAWLRASHRPAEFAALDVGRPAGTNLEGAWAEQLGPATHGSLSVTASRLDLDGREPESASAQLDLRHALSPQWSLNGGLGAGHFRASDASSLGRRTLSLGTSYDTARFGASAQYRYQQTTANDDGGHGARLALRAQHEGLRANLYLDAQQNAPALDLILPPGSEIANAFAELGFIATSPEQVMRLLREHASLFSQYGITTGELREDELRIQGGLDVAWQRSDALRSRFGFRLLADEARGIEDRRRTFLATVFASWRIREDLELELGYTRWAMRESVGDDDRRDSFQVAIRKQFDNISMPGAGRRAIRGRVHLDPVVRTTPGAEALPVVGVIVELDGGTRRALTDAEGRFEFDSPGPGTHRLVATLPADSSAYFTSASTQTVRAGDEVSFGVRPAPARVVGRVLSDAGQPLPGIGVRVGGATPRTVVTDAQGVFRIATPPGVVEIAVIPESVPVGYELGDLAPRSVDVAVGTPATAGFTLQAQRSLRGIVEGTQQATSVTAIEIGLSVSTDAQGNFILRGLPAGPLTLLIRSANGESRQAVIVPDAPGRIDGVTLRAP